MAIKFRYKAVTQEGRKVSGYVEAEEEYEARRAVDAKGLIPLDVTRPAKGLENLKIMTKASIKHDDLIFFTRKLLTLSKAGIPILRSMDIIIDDTEDKKLADNLTQVRKAIEGGSALAEALKPYDGYFPTLFIEAVSAGEESGTLDVMLGRTIELLEREAKIKDNIKAAVRYPLYVMATMAVAFAIVITFVIPKFASLYSAYGSQLPWATRLLIDVNTFIKHYWPIVIFAIPIIIIGLWRFRLTEWGKKGYDYSTLSFPSFGPSMVKAAMSRLCYTLATLITAGLPLSRALVILRGSIGNYYFSKVIEKMGENLSGGRDLLEPAKESRFFSQLVIQMFSIGLESGSLENLLSETAAHFDAEIEYDTRKLTSRIEPILTILIAVMVLILALAIFTPMWNMIKVFGK